VHPLGVTEREKKSEIAQAVGKKIRRYREGRLGPMNKSGRSPRGLRGHLRIADVAAKAGVNPDYWTRVESGRAELSVEMLTRIAKGLGVRPADLLPESHKMPTAKAVALDELRSFLEQYDAADVRLVFDVAQVILARKR
jgi:transcriptional regulator with XRE-family HTH domain